MGMRSLPLTVIHPAEDSCVRRVPLFSGLTAQQQDVVASLARPRAYRRGELITAGQEGSGLMGVVHTGQVMLHRVLPSGRRRLVRVAGPGETVGEHRFLAGEATAEEAEAMADTSLCVFLHEDLTGLVADHPSIALRLLEDLGQRLARAEHLLALGALDVDARIADHLLQLPLVRADGDGGVLRVRLPLSKKDIASLLGTTPESYSRALTRLTRDGLITVDADLVTLLEPQRLEDLVSQA